MDIREIREKLHTKEYEFIRNNKYLASNLILLAVSGSHAYGTNNEESDLDIRGIALNSKSEILLGNDFEQVEDRNTDTVIFSFNKMIGLLTNCNPNVIEQLGLLPEHYLYLNDIGKEILDKRKMFLSKICINKFEGFASSQLRKLENKYMRSISQDKREEHILESIKNAQYGFKARYNSYDEQNVKIYIDRDNEHKNEICVDLSLKGYPLRECVTMLSEMKGIISSYDNAEKQNKEEVTAKHISKRMVHLLRLYMMGIDLLEKEEIITYRKDEHNLLVDVRNGKYLDSNNEVIAEYYELLDDYKKRFRYAKDNTALSSTPNYNEINSFRMDINERVIKGDI